MKKPETTQEAFDNFHKAIGNLGKVMKKERFLEKLLTIAFTLMVLNMSITCMIYALKNPSKTQTEVFLHIPESFEWNFN